MESRVVRQLPSGHTKTKIGVYVHIFMLSGHSSVILVQFVSCLVKLFHICLCTTTFPSPWKFAYIQPVAKKCDSCDLSSSLKLPTYKLSCLSQALEYILHRNIQKHLSVNNLLTHLQYGFRKRKIH